MKRILPHLLAASLFGLVGCQPAYNTHAGSSTTSATAGDMPPQVPPAVLEQAQGLIGLQNTPRGFMSQAANVACEHPGDAGTLGDQGDWSYMLFVCTEYTVIALAKKQSGTSDQTVERIVDVLALPETYPPQGEPAPAPFPWRLSGHIKNDGCAVEGFANDNLPMVFGLSRRKELPVVKLAQAWTFDFALGKIVPFDPSKVECDYVEP